MFSLIRSVPLRHLLLEQVPALGISLIVAEVFYKFHSFTLECMAFLATWYVVDAAFALSKQWLSAKDSTAAPERR
jgi:hypothetical protein